jgi:hypothetical protein
VGCCAPPEAVAFSGEGETGGIQRNGQGGGARSSVFLGISLVGLPGNERVDRIKKL